MLGVELGSAKGEARAVAMHGPCGSTFYDRENFGEWGCTGDLKGAILEVSYPLGQVSTVSLQWVRYKSRSEAIEEAKQLVKLISSRLGLGPSAVPVVCEVAGSGDCNWLWQLKGSKAVSLALAQITDAPGLSVAVVVRTQ